MSRETTITCDKCGLSIEPLDPAFDGRQIAGAGSLAVLARVGGGMGHNNHKRGFAADTISKHPEYWTGLRGRAHRRRGGPHAAGKRLKLRPMRLDEDVWRALQAMKGQYKTINEGLSAAFAAYRAEEQGRE